MVAAPPRSPLHRSSSGFGVTLDLDQFVKEIRVLNIRHMQDRFAKAIAQQVQQVWGEVAQGRQLPTMPEPIDPAVRLAVALARHGAVQQQGDGQWSVTIGDEAAQDELQRIEDGYPAYDMKPGLLANAPHRTAEGQAYTIVPFRHATPGSSGEGGKFASIMPQEIYDVARTLEQDEELISGQVPLTKPNMGPPMSGDYTHKAGIYNAMRKYGKKGAAQYMTFRTVSQASDPNSWMHPGKEGVPLRDAVIKEVTEKFLPKLYAQYFGKQKSR